MFFLRNYISASISELCNTDNRNITRGFILISFAHLGCVLPHAVQNKLNMAAVQLHKLGFDKFGWVVVPGNTDCLSCCADGFQHKVNYLVQTVFVNFAVLNEMIVFDIVLDNFPVNLYCVIAFRFRSFPFRRRSRFALCKGQGI